MEKKVSDVVIVVMVVVVSLLMAMSMWKLAHAPRTLDEAFEANGYTVTESDGRKEWSR